MLARFYSIYLVNKWKSWNPFFSSLEITIIKVVAMMWWCLRCRNIFFMIVFSATMQRERKIITFFLLQNGTRSRKRLSLYFEPFENNNNFSFSSFNSLSDSLTISLLSQWRHSFNDHCRNWHFLFFYIFFTFYTIVK